MGTVLSGTDTAAGTDKDLTSSSVFVGDKAGSGTHNGMTLYTVRKPITPNSISVAL